MEVGAALGSVTMRLWSSVSCMKEGGQQLRLQSCISRELTLAYSGTFLDEYHWNVPAGQKDSRQLVNIQELLFSGSKMVHPDEQEFEQSGQETVWMNMELLSILKHK